MKTKLSIFITCILSSVLIACSSGGGGGGGGGTSVSTPTVPAGATTFDNSADTEEAAQAVVSNLLGTLFLENIVGVEASVDDISAFQILGLIRDKIEKRDRSATSTVVGPSDQYTCFTSGTIDYSWTVKTDTANLYEETGTVAFNGCDDGIGITIDGTAQYEYSENYQTDEITDSATSSSITAAASGVTLTLSDISYDYLENWTSGDFQFDTFQFAAEISTGGGFAVITTSSIMGNWYTGCALNAGVIELTGDNSTQAKITIMSNGDETVEYDDGSGFTPTDNSPLSCLY